MKKRILTGIRPTGRLHVGHYFGMLRQIAELQDDFESLVMIADVQALTDNFHRPQKVRAMVLEVAYDLIAGGVDPARSTLFIQSLIPEIAELTLYYGNLVTISRLQQNPTVKAEIAQKRALFGNSVTYGFLGYPVSQAADITAFDADLVPVGEDQLPQIELTREIVRKFNQLYGPTLKEPQARVLHTARIRGLDGGSKMGKSLGNALFLSDEAATVDRKIRSALTDPQKLHLHDPGHPEVCTVFEYHGLFNREGLGSIAAECRSGVRGCVACKRELAERVNAFLEPHRRRRAELEARPSEVLEILMEGTRRARAIAREVLARVKERLHLDYLGGVA
ncbi:tryptophan--tRNA ligase [Meiothermus sp. PNK-Is4]|nr:tryptophan--tRNA ligase [Meiothermus sp. PNK-Is4]PZA07632.1 tryptophan--tRNA ligase [Meiothermus sp. Pnk-1]RYM36827.1 tryptophan--tRNA ligase [Meiothermus sp. PNK-Is4]